MGIPNLTGQIFKNVKHSAVFDHLLQCDCTINYIYHENLSFSKIFTFPPISFILSYSLKCYHSLLFFFSVSFTKSSISGIDLYPKKKSKRIH